MLEKAELRHKERRIQYLGEAGFNPAYKVLAQPTLRQNITPGPREEQLLLGIILGKEIGISRVAGRHRN